MYIKNICHNFYVAFLYLPFCLSFFVYPIMLINTLFCLFDLMLHTYMCLCDCSKNWRCIYWPRHLHLWFMVNLVDILYLFILKPFLFHNGQGAWVAQWARPLDLTAHTSLSPIWHGFVPSFVNNKKGALDSQPQVIKFTSYLSRVGGSLRVLWLPPPLKLVAMIIYLKYCWKWC
jgi:hypothetical protein